MMTVPTSVNFQSSKVKKMIDPNPTICQRIEQLERVFSDLNLYDEVNEQLGSPYSHIIYNKEGHEVLSMGIAKSDYYLKLTGYQWDLTPFLQLSIEMEFTIEKTLSWKLMSIENVDFLALEKAIHEALKPHKDLHQLMKYILLAIKGYESKASFLRGTTKQIEEHVLDHFWAGEINVISQLYEKKMSSKSDIYKKFVKKWEEKLDYAPIIVGNCFSTEMDIDRLTLSNHLKTIQFYINQQVNKYIHSIKNLWFDGELIHDEVKFYKEIDLIRSLIIISQEYSNDMNNLFLEERNTVESKNEVELEDRLINFLHQKPKSSNRITYLNSSDITDGKSVLLINEDILDKLASALSDGYKNKKDYLNLIRIIFNKSLTKGFTVRDIVRIFFINMYDNVEERKDFEQRYGVRRLFVKSTLENLFDVLMDNLIKVNIIKEERVVMQLKEQDKISFNYNFKIYDLKLNTK